MIVDLHAWLRDGSPPELAARTHEDDVRRLLGEPEKTGGGSRRKPRPTVWRYGDLELGFEERRVRYIHVDMAGLDVGARPTGTAHVRVEAWCIRARMSRALLEHELTTAGIAHRIEPDPPNLGVRIVCVSGASMILGERGEQLHAIYFV